MGNCCVKSNSEVEQKRSKRVIVSDSQKVLVNSIDLQPKSVRMPSEPTKVGVCGAFLFAGAHSSGDTMIFDEFGAEMRVAVTEGLARALCVPAARISVAVVDRETARAAGAAAAVRFLLRSPSENGISEWDLSATLQSLFTDRDSDLFTKTPKIFTNIKEMKVQSRTNSDPLRCELVSHQCAARMILLPGEGGQKGSGELCKLFESFALGSSTTSVVKTEKSAPKPRETVQQSNLSPEIGLEVIKKEVATTGPELPSVLLTQLVPPESENREKMKVDIDCHQAGSGCAPMDTDSKLFVCDDCGRSFLHKRSLNRHVKSNHVGGYGSCQLCGGGVFTQKVSYGKHIMSQKHLRVLVSYLETNYPNHVVADNLKVDRKFCRYLVTRHLEKMNLTHIEGVIRANQSDDDGNNNGIKPEYDAGRSRKMQEFRNSSESTIMESSSSRERSRSPVRIKHESHGTPEKHSFNNATPASDIQHTGNNIPQVLGQSLQRVQFIHPPPVVNPSQPHWTHPPPVANPNQSQWTQAAHRVQAPQMLLQLRPVVIPVGTTVGGETVMVCPGIQPMACDMSEIRPAPCDMFGNTPLVITPTLLEVMKEERGAPHIPAGTFIKQVQFGEAGPLFRESNISLSIERSESSRTHSSVTSREPLGSFDALVPPRGDAGSLLRAISASMSADNSVLAAAGGPKDVNRMVDTFMEGSRGHNYSITSADMRDVDEFLA
eukprot:197850_1